MDIKEQRTILLDQMYGYCLEFQKVNAKPDVPLHILSRQFSKRAKPFFPERIIDLVRSDKRFASMLRPDGGFNICAMDVERMEQVRRFRELMRSGSPADEINALLNDSPAEPV